MTLVHEADDIILRIETAKYVMRCGYRWGIGPHYRYPLAHKYGREGSKAMGLSFAAADLVDLKLGHPVIINTGPIRTVRYIPPRAVAVRVTDTLPAGRIFAMQICARE